MIRPAVVAVLLAAAPAVALNVGDQAPDFTLTDLEGRSVTLSQFKGKTVVLEWFNPGCPYVQASHTVGSLVGLADKHQAKGVVWLAINSNAAGKQGAGRETNLKAVKAFKLKHPLLLDESGKVGKAYGATRTPEMFVIDPTGRVVYAGAIDNSPDGEGGRPTGGTLINHVDVALTALAAGNPVTTSTTKAYGCTVKYVD